MVISLNQAQYVLIALGEAIFKEAMEFVRLFYLISNDLFFF
jgi:hypothetical protein